ncbi:hypothetical protein GA0070216_11737 [Micromonospora matsumotoense]|uniref:Uncharacterized protein n=1 Tax=Micromonospora matsumotoense TaxID=121616 RepID=A0A1C5AGN1_9ACTN|nr:hypothetical protein GA0070216_11737 [Micromonospora matsumotoense]
MNTAATDLPVPAADEKVTGPQAAPRPSEHTPYPGRLSDRAPVTPEGGEQS